jgi:O-methyltransferase
MNIKSSIRWVLNKIGYGVYRIPDTTDKNHEKVLPVATYAPWNKDNSFETIYEIINNFTLVDKYRCFELWTLIQQCEKLESGSIIEIGVWRGGTGALIAQQAKKCGISDPVYLCDTFTGVVKAGSNDSNYKGGEHADTSRKIVEELLFNKLFLDNVQIIQGIFPEETSHTIENEKFRFCHIDVDVYQSAKDIVDWIWDKMVRGGVIVFDDYGFHWSDGITKYIEEQIPFKDRFVLHNLNGHAIIIKL